MATVHVVLAVDTEGPAWDPKLGLLGTWAEVEGAVARVCAPKFRERQRDSMGRTPIISWFVLDWTGFLTNPVRRSFGYHQVFDRYLTFLARSPEDRLFWHYHHPPLDGVGNHWNTSWAADPPWIEGREYENILNRKILDRRWFPNAFRAGGTIEDNDASRWLEQWIPFDFSNRSPLKVDGVADWSAAPTAWDVYHPSEADYQQPGGMARFIARCLDLESRAYSVTDDEIAQAFDHARATGASILAVFVHDYREMAGPFRRFVERVSAVARGFSNVRWRYAAADDAVQRRVGMDGERLRLHVGVDDGRAVIAASRPLFGSRPYVCGRTRDGRMLRLADVQARGQQWVCPLPADGQVETLGVAANAENGTTDVVVVELQA